MFRLVLSFAFALTASTAQTLLRDINQSPDSQIYAGAPAEMTRLGSRMIFSAQVPAFGRELWVSDGSAGGTAMLFDIWPGRNGANPMQFVVLPSGVALFSATTETLGWELWRTDGTAAGTALVKDIRPGVEGSVAIELTKVGNSVFFFANDGVHGVELWRSDGTAAGTALVADVVPGLGGISNGTNQLGAFGAGVLFSVRDQGWSVWFSDGTASGTRLVRQMLSLPATSGPMQFVDLGGRAVFWGRVDGGPEELWATDGTAAGTLSLGVPPASSGLLTPFTTVTGRAYFSGGPANEQELWRTDGTASGTARVIDLNGSASAAPNAVAVLASGDLLFTARSGSGSDLWRTDGTANGTSLLRNGLAWSHSSFAVDAETVTGGVVFAAGSAATGTELWISDGTPAGTQLVADIAPGSADAAPAWLAELHGQVLFAADDGLLGTELWRTDGTVAGTSLLRNVAPERVSRGSSAAVMGVFDDRAYIRATDGVVASQLWVTDGTTAGTQHFLDIRVGGFGAPTNLVALDDRFLFFADDGMTGTEPWVSDGTPAGTRLLIDLLPGLPASAAGGLMRRVRDRILFVANDGVTGSEPWATDGTVAGTRRLADVQPGIRGSVINAVVALGDRLLFGATDGTGRALYVTDGTPAGTHRVAAVPAGDVTIAVELGGFVYFAPNANQLWRTDATAAGTGLVIDLTPGNQANGIAHLHTLGNELAFFANDGSGMALWRSDGTASGTRRAFYTAGPLADSFSPVVPLGARTLFALGNNGGTSPNSAALFSTDGTAAGTVWLRNFARGPVAPASFGGTSAVFSFDDGIAGFEVWSSDGTPSGPRALTAVNATNPALNPLFQDRFVRLRDRLLFSADDGLHGLELHVLPFVETGDFAVRAYGSGCPGSGGRTPRLAITGDARGSAPAPFDIELRDGAANAAGAVVVASASDRLPLTGGCRLWIGGAMFSAPIATDGSGFARLSVPPSPLLAGFRVHLQGLVIDPQGAYFGLVSSSGAIELVIGR